jgi:hypothetical protein
MRVHAAVRDFMMESGAAADHVPGLPVPIENCA